MSNIYDTKAARVRAPYDGDIGTANSFGVLKFTCGTDHAINALPSGWAGRWVRIYVTGSDLHYAFSTASNAEVDRSVSASAAGATAKVGDVLVDGSSEQVLLPEIKVNQTLYFVRESAATAVVYMRLADR